MKTRKTNISERDKLYTKLDAYCRTLNRRSINYTIETYSQYFASIIIQIVGKRATAQKKLVLYYDTEAKHWIGVINAKEYILTSLSEVTIILKTKISQLMGWVQKY